jgi:hypothetical protein
MRHTGRLLSGVLGFFLLSITHGMAQNPASSSSTAALIESTQKLLQEQLVLDKQMCHLSGQWASGVIDERDRGKPLADMLKLMRELLTLHPGWVPWFEAITIRHYSMRITVPKLVQMIPGMEEATCLDAVFQRNRQPIPPRNPQ